MKKGILAALLCLCLLVPLLPQTALALSNGKDIQLGIDAISSNSLLWFGHYDNAPINWQVTPPPASGNSLISKHVLFKAAYENAVFVTDKPNLTYDTSSLYTSTLAHFKQDSANFSVAEQAVLSRIDLPAYDMGEAFARDGSSWPYWLGKALTKGFLPPEQITEYWFGSAVLPGLREQLVLLTGNYGIRPTIDLDQSFILFAAAATGGKLAHNVGALTSVPDYSGDEWKLTLEDPSRNDFRARLSGGASSATVTPGGNITLDYAKANTEANDWLSALLVDESDNALYYGHIAHSTPSGMAVPMTIPATLPEGNYTLKLFDEQCNGDYQTDYSSYFVDIPLTVTASAPTIDVFVYEPTANGSDTETTTKLTLVFDVYDVVNEDIVDFSVDDINLVGASKGTLTQEAGMGVYTLDITDIRVSDKKYIKVSFHKAGYNFMPASLNVTVRVYTPAINYISIGASSSPEAYGSVTGAGSVPAGTDVTLIATANTGCEFVHWLENGIVVSNFAHYRFTATENRSLVAVFAAIPAASTIDNGSQQEALPLLLLTAPSPPTVGYTQTTQLLSLPRTGESSRPMLFSGLLLLAVLALAGLRLYHRPNSGNSSPKESKSA